MILQNESDTGRNPTEHRAKYAAKYIAFMDVLSLLNNILFRYIIQIQIVQIWFNSVNK